MTDPHELTPEEIAELKALMVKVRDSMNDVHFLVQRPDGPFCECGQPWPDCPDWRLMEALPALVKAAEERDRLERLFVGPLLDDDTDRSDETLEFWRTDYQHASKMLENVEHILERGERILKRAEKAERDLSEVDQHLHPSPDEHNRIEVLERLKRDSRVLHEIEAEACEVGGEQGVGYLHDAGLLTNERKND